MNRSLVCLLTLCLLAVAAFSPAALAASPTSPAPALGIPPAASPTAVPTVTLPPLDPSRLAGSLPASGDASQINTYLREVTGLREQLGPKADELFRLVDQVESAAVQDILRQLHPAVKPKGMPAPLPPRVGSTPRTDQFAGLLTAMSLLWEAPNLVQRAGNGPVEPLPVKESDKTVGDNATAHITLTPHISGCHAEIDVTVTIRAELEGTVYEDKATGKISMTICPDEAGKVPLDIALDDDIRIKGVHLNMHLADHAIGQVDDEGNLTGVEHDMETGLDMPTGTNWFTGAPVNSSVLVRQQVRQTGLNAPDHMWGSMTRTGGNVVNESFPPNGDLRFRAAGMGPYMIWSMEKPAFRNAEEKWKDSYCVAVIVPEGSDTYSPPGKMIDVLKDSEKPFTASVKHQFEGKELTVPVVATLTSGEVSVTPSGAKVPAPATFRYKAPEEVHFQNEATVELVSRSRRGIGKLNVIFHTEEVSYRVEAPWGSDLIRLQGTICSFTQPFTLKLTGRKPGGNFPYTGKVEFTPKDATSGSWLWTGQYTIPYSPPTSDKGGSTYQVTGLKEGKPMIVLNEFDHMGSAPGIFSQTDHYPGWQIELDPKTGTCFPE